MRRFLAFPFLLYEFFFVPKIQFEVEKVRNWQSTAVEPASQSTTGDKNTLRIGGKKKKNEVKEKEGIPYTTKLKMVKTIESYICMCGDTPHLVPLIFLCSTFLKLPTRKSSFTYARDRIKKKKRKERSTAPYSGMVFILSFSPSHSFFCSYHHNLLPPFLSGHSMFSRTCIQ